MDNFILFPFVHVLTEWTASNFLTQAAAAIVVCGLILMVKSVIVAGDN